ncbi:hypothetical protein SAMN05428970_0453 [Agromyces sp. CF514]|uniref:hypothetical protein n=1 Tax=Agromyces sp. CF514 TaxID=1881031 RepID=UPI0008EB6162|nr:hypothetical protein [Agromyces sp. CF514]SFR68550.1 hypothetical protein SAMN05428970_0453 [Agromyces sp. CF514]
MQKILGLALAAVTVGLLAGCAPASRNAGGPSASGAADSPSSSPTLSSTDLPTLKPPTAPPTDPTDVLPNGTVAGRVSATSEGCIDVTTDDGDVWSLTGAVDVVIAVGDTVLAKVEPLPTDVDSCGSGAPARIVSISLVG